MSTQSLKEHVSKEPLSRNVFKTRKSKLQRIHVAPSPQLSRKVAVTDDKWPASGNGNGSLFLESKEDQSRVGTPSAHESITFEVDDAKVIWSKADNGNHDHQFASWTLPHRRRCGCGNEVYMMRFLIALAFIFSIANLLLTIILTQGQEGNCACQEKSELKGKVLYLQCKIMH